MKMNILTAKTGTKAEAPVEITKEEFWEMYLLMLGLRRDIDILTSKELRIMSIVLAGDPNKSYFNGTEAAKLKSRMRIKRSDLSKIKAQLVLKKYIEDTGVTRGDALVTRKLRNFQRYVHENFKKGILPDLSFIFSFTLKEDEEPTRHILGDSERARNTQNTSGLRNQTVLDSNAKVVNQPLDDQEIDQAGMAGKVLHQGVLNEKVTGLLQ